jgi:LysR family transcriptional regulator, hydrogen peroxide-inducible genes activator
MNIQQLEYIVAVDTYRHFGKAAEKSFITQPTLSAMIHKLEEELEVRIFQRKEHPVTPTAIGKQIINQARIILSEIKRIQSIVNESVGEAKGELHIGIIPTLAPYLLPLFLPRFAAKYSQVQITINEMLTEDIIGGLKKEKLDVGLLVTPLRDRALLETPLFYEEFVVYVSVHEAAYKMKQIVPKEIDTSKLWLLEEGHCFRSQIMNLCNLRKSSELKKHVHYEAGSIETLKKMVERNEGITILPELALIHMSEPDLSMVRRFQAPTPVREVSIVTHKDFGKQNLTNVLKKEILASIPENMTRPNQRVIIKR